jgi:hypothetical protein
MWQIAEELRASQGSLGLGELTKCVSAALQHEWHERTIRRDCELLSHFGLITTGGTPVSYRWRKQWFARREATAQVESLCDRIISGDDLELNASLDACRT